MSKGLPRSLARGLPVKQPITKLTIPFRDYPVTVTANGDVAGTGSEPFLQLPEGNILVLGAAASLAFKTDSADVEADFEGDFAVGTAANVDQDLTDAGEFNILPATAIPAATAGATGPVRAASAPGADMLHGLILDNTAGDALLYLNLMIDNADFAPSGEAEVLVNGFVSLALVVLGDD